MPSELTGFFCPKSVAVLGASRTADKVGSIILRNIINAGFKGKIYPINPNADVLNDLPCYKDVFSLPEKPDLVVIALPAELSVSLLEDVGKAGIKNAVILAAGFKETGEEGKVLENRLIEIANKYLINVLGPNCLGFVNNECNLNATFGQPVNTLGNIKFISQSGAVAASVFDWASSLGFGLSEFITLGNKSVLTENEVLNYFLSLSKNDPKANWPIGMYLESISDGAQFLKLTTELSKKHALFIIKPGKTEAAATAMKSHTGAMTGEDDVLDTALEQAGVIRCQTLEDFFDAARGFSWGIIPNGPRVAVVSNAGGPGVLTADAVILEGLELAQFDEKTKKDLLAVLPRSASIHDPVDLLGDAMAERYGKAAEILLQNLSVDAVLFILTPQLMTQIEQTAEYISMLCKKYKKPVFCSFIGGSKIFEGEQVLNKNKIPVFRYPERAIYVISQMWKYRQNQIALNTQPSHEEIISLPQDGGEIRAIIQEAVNERYAALDNVSADKLVKSIGISTPETSNITSYEEALSFAKTVGWPVVLKISSHGILHKKKLGGVITGIADENALQHAFQNLQGKVEELSKESNKVQIQIQKSISDGVEVIVGLKKDPTFEYVLMFGAGGSFVELIGDKNLHLLPIVISQAKKLVEKSKIYKILKNGNYNLNNLYDLIVRVSKLSTVVQEAREIEINPVIVTSDNVWAVDTKIVMTENNLPSQAAASKTAGPKLKIATTLEHVTLASKFNHYKFESDEPLVFSPGQYISVKVADTAIRAYSIATRYDDKHFDLLVDTRPGGPGSQFFEKLKPGDKMQFLGPFGKFIYTEEDGAEDLLFLATGSGASAVRCMIDHALLERHTTKKLKLYFGLTSDFEVFWQDHFAELSVKYPNFSFEIALFKPSENWVGAKGFITELVKRDYSDARKCSAYLCGHRAMISDASDILIANGCPKERIYTEKFV